MHGLTFVKAGIDACKRARTHTHISTHDRTHTYRQTDIHDTNTHKHIHDTNVGHILAFVTCVGNTYDVRMRMHISTSMCASAA